MWLLDLRRRQTHVDAFPRDGVKGALTTISRSTRKIRSDPRTVSLTAPQPEASGRTPRKQASASRSALQRWLDAGPTSRH